MTALDGKVAIVTGASRGIGGISRGPWRPRADVASRPAPEVHPTSGCPAPSTRDRTISVARRPRRPSTVRTRDPESIASCVHRPWPRLRPVDILVNNAAIFVPGSLESVQPRHLELIWQIDLRGPILPSGRRSRACGRRLGHIINMSSRVTTYPGPGPYQDGRDGLVIFYGMEKSGLDRYFTAHGDGTPGQHLGQRAVPDAGSGRRALSLRRTTRRTPTWTSRAADMGAAAAWICEQPPSKFTGNIVFDEELCAEMGIEPRTDRPPPGAAQQLAADLRQAQVRTLPSATSSAIAPTVSSISSRTATYICLPALPDRLQPAHQKVLERDPRGGVGSGRRCS